jgi:ribosomal protein L35AE/L33A
MERESGKFLAYDRMMALIGEQQIATVPLVWQGKGTDRALQKYIGEEVLRRKSAFGDELLEGVYIRFEGDDGYVRDRVKMRRKTFTAGRENFTSHIENNELNSNAST